MGLLLRALRPTADAVCQVAAELRPDWARLLSRELSGIGSCAADSGAAPVFIYGNGVCAIDLSAGNPAEKIGKATEPFSIGSTAVSPVDQSVDAGGGVAR